MNDKLSAQSACKNRVENKKLAVSQVPVFAAPEDNSFTFSLLPDGSLSDFEPQVETILGYSADQCQQHFFSYMTDSDINVEVMPRIEAALLDIRQPPFEIELQSKHGESMRLEITMVPHYQADGQLHKVESVVHNISIVQRKLSGYKRKSILLDEAEKIACMGTWDWDMVNDNVRWSPVFYTIIQLSPEQIKPGMQAYKALLKPEDGDTLVDNIVRSIKTHEVFEHFHRIFLQDGSIKYIESRGNTLLDEQGKPVRMIGTIHDVTNQVEAQGQLEKAYRMINSGINEIYIIDRESYRFSFASEGACRNLGYSQKEITQMTPFDLCPVIPKLQVIEMMAPVMEHKEEMVIFEASHLRKDGSTYPVEVRLQLMDKEGPPMFVAVVMDISSKRAAWQKVREQALFLQSIIDNTNESIMVVDVYREIRLLNRTAKHFIEQGILLSPVQRQSTIDHQGKRQSCPLTKVFEHKAHSTVVIDHSLDDGTVRHIEVMVSPLLDENGEVTAAVEIGRDISAHLQLQEQLQQQKNAFQYSAHYDSLTKLPNRVLFHDRLTQSIAKARRHKEGLAVFFLDLDRFKQINDTYGHAVGDKVLQSTAARLKGCVREMDSVARLGGDEFTVILESIRKPQSAALIASKINQAMLPPIVVDGRELFVTSSIGIALYPENGETMEELIECADAAMYRVKQESRDAFQFYSENLTGRAFERALMENQLRSALENKELKVFYQTQLSLDSGVVTGIEALVRWNNPQLGSIMPTKFIPLAEDVGLIQAIDEWVLQTACRQMVQWKKQGLGDIRLAVNLSTAEFGRKNLFDIVTSILQDTGCQPQWLEFEVTEGSFTGSPEQVRTVLERFERLGIKLAIDDFGTGFSSMSNLRYMSISKLKIDHSFINNVPDSADDTAITTAVIKLAKSLGMKVVAEGVETEIQRNFLSAQQCDQAQGYLFSRPISAELMTEKLHLPGAA